jgi:mRNA-degrading endonuclease RelE of RelBE toxin-antitoxin system
MWEVKFTARATKQVGRLPEKIRRSLKSLVKDLELSGPIAASWANFAKFKEHQDCYHCHLKKGRPSYVAVWRVADRGIKLIEVRYVGIHEDADYRKIC